MNKYEKLLNEAVSEGISVDENYTFRGKLKGLYINGNIALSDQLDTTAEKSCILAEELGHHYTSYGNILNLSNIQNAKQEHQARGWAFDKQIGLQGLIDAFEYGCNTSYETAEFLEVTEIFLQEAIDYYRNKFGASVIHNNYYILFIPNLAVGKLVKKD